MSFKIDFANYCTSEVPTLTAELIGHFSIDGDSNYQDDLSQLKYYSPPSDPNNVNFDLNFNCQSTQHKSTSYIKLDYILRWISDNFHRLEGPLSVQEERWFDTDFICSRGALKTITCSPYIDWDEWIICASKYRDTIYLCEFYTDEKEHYYATQSVLEKQIFSRGKKFEQYMAADHPSHTPDPKQPLNENEEFHCMFKAKFDYHSLLYNAEIDCISSQQPVMDTLVGKPIELIELKTCPMYKKNEMYRFPRHKVSMLWSQNYFVHINRIICGLKDENAKVKIIKEYPVHELSELSRMSCDQCKLFCKIFLDNVKRIVTKDYDKCIYKFHWKSSAKDVVTYSEEAPNNERYFFMKPWFVNKAEDYRRRFQ